ncbi:MAG: radical SAM protein [Ignavibacteriales bacterium]|nr:radical SAM protein [Ignavibacteriales bacterium]
MIKHILTAECNRSCSYCITKNVKIDEINSEILEQKLPDLYWRLSMRCDSIMLTGGEPSLSKYFARYVYYAGQYFKHVFITTQNEWLLNWEHSKDYFEAITFSWHDPKAWRYAVTNGAAVYASILTHLYSDWLVDTVRKLGYTGLTINENHFGTDVFDEKQLPQIKGFSIKVNRRGKCIDDETIFIMPDLSVRKNFKEFL